MPALERRSQGTGDTLLMKLCCIQLFNAGELADSLRSWAAKEAGFDSHCSIDVQLLCGQGLAETKAYLASHASPEAAEALAHLRKCEQARDFEGFSVKAYAAWWDRYYRVDQH